MDIFIVLIYIYTTRNTNFIRDLSIILKLFSIYHYCPLNFFRQHKCPHRPLGIVGKSGPCPVTEYKNEYKAFEGNRRQLIKPDSDYRPSDIPMADMTTNK